MSERLPTPLVYGAPSSTSGRLARRLRAFVASTHGRWLLAILVVALALRVGWVLYAGTEPRDYDPRWYDERGLRLAEGLGYTLANGEATAYFPPGYPLFLAGFYKTLGYRHMPVELSQALLGAASVGLVYVLACRTVGRRTALAAAGLLALYPAQIFYAAMHCSELLFTFLALLITVSIVLLGDRQGRWWWPALWAVGLLVGSATLVRPQGALLLVALAVYWLALGLPWRRLGPGLALVACGAAVAICPWSVRNLISMGSPVLLSTNGWVDFWMGNHPDASGTADQPPPELFPYTEWTTERELEWERIGRELGLAYIREQPLDALLRVPKKLYFVFAGDNSVFFVENQGASPFLSPFRRQLLTSVANAYYWMVMALAVLGIRLWWPDRRFPARHLITSLLLSWLLLYLVIFGDPRFHEPFMPFVCILAAPALAAILDASRPARGGDGGAMGAAPPSPS